MITETSLTLAELQNYYSDYHKDYYGFRPKCSQSEWESREFLVSECELIDWSIKNAVQNTERKAAMEAEGWRFFS